ncbi:MAG: arginine N-succinyltransferase [Kofleriaceae bacterium]|nr:arginine N-succinyltransferase [Kofleriaceae bacterium]
MYIVRESTPDDLEQILRVAKHLDSYNLPFDRESIRSILAASSNAFHSREEGEEGAFTFVVEDSETREVVGTSMLYAQHGTHKSPHVYLDVLQDEHYSETLEKYLVHQALRIGYNYNGPTEIGGLILLPEYRGHKESLGKLLSYTRFLFIAMNRSVFRDEVLSELLPRLEDDGTSRLWKHYGKRFTGLSYREADRLSKDNKEFIKSLFPQGLVYTSLFPKDVQDEIGEVGPQTKGVEKMLKRIGFRYAQQIDPFDGGPHYIANTDEITLVSGSSEFTLGLNPASDTADRYLIAQAHTDETPFQCTWSGLEIDKDSANIDERSMQAMGLSAGTAIWAVKV